MTKSRPAEAKDFFEFLDRESTERSSKIAEVDFKVDITAAEFAELSPIIMAEAKRICERHPVLKSETWAQKVQRHRPRILEYISDNSKKLRSSLANQLKSGSLSKDELLQLEKNLITAIANNQPHDTIMSALNAYKTFLEKDVTAVKADIDNSWIDKLEDLFIKAYAPVEMIERISKGVLNQLKPDPAPTEEEIKKFNTPMDTNQRLALVYGHESKEAEAARVSRYEERRPIIIVRFLWFQTLSTVLVKNLKNSPPDNDKILHALREYKDFINRIGQSKEWKRVIQLDAFENIIVSTLFPHATVAEHLKNINVWQSKLRPTDRLTYEDTGSEDYEKYFKERNRILSRGIDKKYAELKGQGTIANRAQLICSAILALQVGNSEQQAVIIESVEKYLKGKDSYLTNDYSHPFVDIIPVELIKLIDVSSPEVGLKRRDTVTNLRHRPSFSSHAVVGGLSRAPSRLAAISTEAEDNIKYFKVGTLEIFSRAYLDAFNNNEAKYNIALEDRGVGNASFYIEIYQYAKNNRSAFPIAPNEAELKELCQDYVYKDILSKEVNKYKAQNGMIQDALIVELITGRSISLTLDLLSSKLNFEKTLVAAWKPDDSKAHIGNFHNDKIKYLQEHKETLPKIEAEAKDKLISTLNLDVLAKAQTETKLAKKSPLSRTMSHAPSPSSGSASLPRSPARASLGSPAALQRALAGGSPKSTTLGVPGGSPKSTTLEVPGGSPKSATLEVPGRGSPKSAESPGARSSGTPTHKSLLVHSSPSTVHSAPGMFQPTTASALFVSRNLLRKDKKATQASESVASIPGVVEPVEKEREKDKEPTPKVSGSGPGSSSGPRG